MRTAIQRLPAYENNPGTGETGSLRLLSGQKKRATFVSFTFMVLVFKGETKASWGFSLETGDGRGHKLGIKAAGSLRASPKRPIQTDPKQPAALICVCAVERHEKVLSSSLDGGLLGA